MGLFYSSSAVPYTIDMFEVGISGSLYVLDLKKVKYRAVEPYVVMDLGYHQDRYYGAYLDNTPCNRSVSEERLLGRIENIRSSRDGLEFHLFNNQQEFVQLLIKRCQVRHFK